MYFSGRKLNFEFLESTIIEQLKTLPNSSSISPFFVPVTSIGPTIDISSLITFEITILGTSRV